MKGLQKPVRGRLTSVPEFEAICGLRVSEGPVPGGVSISIAL